MEMQVLNIPVAEILNMLIMLLGVAIVIIAAISYHKRSSKPSMQNVNDYTNSANNNNPQPPKAHRSPIDVLVLFYACADSSKWGLFGRCARSAFRRTPSGPEICREFMANTRAKCKAIKNNKRAEISALLCYIHLTFDF